MTMTRAELARCLHGIAVWLENEPDFHKSYCRSTTEADIRRTRIYEYVTKYGTDDQLYFVAANGLLWFNNARFSGREYLRRYLDMRWNLPRPSHASRALRRSSSGSTASSGPIKSVLAKRRPYPNPNPNPRSNPSC